MNLFVDKLPNDLLQNSECEKFAYMRSDEFRNIHETPMYAATARSIEGYLSIKCETTGKIIYRKYHGWTTMDESTIGLGYRSRCELGITEKQLQEAPPIVVVRPASWFWYYWRNSDSGIKMPFKLAFVSCLVALLSFVLQIVFYIFPNCC